MLLYIEIINNKTNSKKSFTLDRSVTMLFIFAYSSPILAIPY